MKNKDNKKPRKIKNYLSSLCKWAKENKYKLFCLCCSIVLLIFVGFGSCASKNITANAETNNSTEGVVITLPTCPLVYTTNHTINTSLSDTVLQVEDNIITIYLTGSYGAIGSYTFSPLEGVLNSFRTSQLTMYGRYVVTENPSVMYASIGLSNTYCTLSILNDSYNTVEDAFRSGAITSVQVILNGSTLTYEFYDNVGVAISVVFSGIRGSLVNFSFFTSFNEFETFESIGAYDEGYEDGYTAGYGTGQNDGYDEGYEDGSTNGYQRGYDEGVIDGNEIGYGQGYSAGYEDGYDNGEVAGLEIGYGIGYNNGESAGYDTGFEYGKEVGYDLGQREGYDTGYIVGYDNGFTAQHGDISPLSIFKTSVDDIFGIQLFGDVAIGDIIRIGFAVVLLGFIIKIFLGG